MLDYNKDSEYPIGTTYVVWSYWQNDEVKKYCYQTITVSDICEQKNIEDYAISITPDEVCYGKNSAVTFTSGMNPAPDAYVMVGTEQAELDVPFDLGSKYGVTTTINYTLKVNHHNIVCEYKGSKDLKVIKPSIDCSNPYYALVKRADDGTAAIPYPVLENNKCVSQYGWVYTVLDEDGNTMKDEDGEEIKGTSDYIHDSIYAKFPDGHFKVRFYLNLGQGEQSETCEKEYYLMTGYEPCATNEGSEEEYKDLVGNDLSGWKLSYGMQDRFGDYYFDDNEARANYYLDLWGKQRLYSAESGIQTGILRRYVAFGGKYTEQDWGRVTDLSLVTGNPTEEGIWADMWNNYYGTVDGSGLSYMPDYNFSTTQQSIQNVYRVSYKTSSQTYMDYYCQSSDIVMPVISGANSVVFGPRFSSADENAAHFYLYSDVTAYDPLFGTTFTHSTSLPEYQLLKMVPEGFKTSMRVGSSSIPFHNSGYLPKAGGAEMYGLNNFNMADGVCTDINNYISDNNAGKVTYTFRDCESSESSSLTASDPLTLAPAANAAADRAQKTFIVNKSQPYLLIDYASVLGVDVSDFPSHKSNYCSDKYNSGNNTYSYVGKEANFSIIVEVEDDGKWVTLPQSIINRAPVTQEGTGNNSLDNLNRNYESDYFHQATFNLDDDCSAYPAGLGFKQTTIGNTTETDATSHNGVADQHNEAFVTTGWNAICFDLRKYIGKRVRLSVQNADCNDFAGHSCYHSAYTYFNARSMDFDLQYCPSTNRVDVKVSNGFDKYAFRLVSGTDTTPMIYVKSSTFAFNNIYGHESGDTRILIYGDDNLLLDTALISTAPSVKISYEGDSYTSTQKIVKFTDSSTYTSSFGSTATRIWRVYAPSTDLTSSTAPSADNTNYKEYTDKEISVEIDKTGQWVYLFVTNNSCCSDKDSVFVDVDTYKPTITCNDYGFAKPLSIIQNGGLKIDGVFNLEHDACIEDPAFKIETEGPDGNEINNISYDLAHGSITGDFKEGYNTVKITATMCGASATCTSRLYITESYTPCYDPEELELYSYDIVGTSFQDWTLSYGSQDHYFNSYYNAHDARKNHASVCKGPDLNSFSYKLSSSNWDTGNKMVLWPQPWDNYYGIVKGSSISDDGWSPDIDWVSGPASFDYVYNVDPTTNGGSDEGIDRQLKVTSRTAAYKNAAVCNFKTEGDINNYRFYIYKSNPGYDPLFGTTYKHTMKDDKYQLLPIMPSAGYAVIRVGCSTVPYHNINDNINYINRGGGSEWTYNNYNKYSSNGTSACENLYPKYKQRYNESLGTTKCFDSYNNKTVSISGAYLGLAPNGHGSADRAQRTFLIDNDNKFLRFRYATILSADNTHMGCHYNKRSTGEMHNGRGANTSVIVEVKHNGTWMRMPESILHMRSIERLPYPNSSDDARDVYFRREGFIYEGQGEVEQEDNYNVATGAHKSNFSKFHQANFTVDSDEGCNLVQGLGYEELTKTELTTKDVNAANFSQENHNETWLTTGWQPISFNLSAYVGDSARLTLEAADCSGRDGKSGMHQSYIYVTSLPANARITYCESSKMVNGAAERGYSNYYVRFLTEKDTTPLILQESNFFALKNPLTGDNVRIEIWGDDIMMYTDTLENFGQAKFEETQKCYNIYDFNKTGDEMDGVSFKYIIYDADENLTADVMPTSTNTNYTVIDGKEALDQTIDDRGQWVYFVATSGECCSDTAKKFILPDVSINVECGDKTSFGTITIDSCGISLQQILDRFDLVGLTRPHNATAECDGSYEIGYNTINSTDYTFISGEEDLSAVKFGYNTVYDYVIKWRFYNKDRSKYVDCDNVIKFKVDFVCPSPISGSLGTISITLPETTSLTNVLSKTSANFPSTLHDYYGSCDADAEKLIFVKKGTEAEALYTSDTANYLLMDGVTYNVRWQLKFSNNQQKVCNLEIAAKTNCPTNSKSPNNTDYLKLSDPCGYKYGDVVELLRGNGLYFPDNSDVWYYNPTALITSSNAYAADEETKMTVGDKQYVAWEYQLVDGSKLYCNYVVNIKCPYGSSYFNNNGNSTEKTLYSNSDNGCTLSLEEVLAQWTEFPFSIKDDSCDSDYTLSFKESNIDISEAIFHKGTSNDYIRLAFSLGTPSNYTGYCNYKFKVDATKSCPFSSLDTLELDVDATKEDEESLLTSQMPIEFYNCSNVLMHLALDKSKLTDDFVEGSIITMPWKVYNSKNQDQKYTCTQVIKIIDDSPMTISCSDAGYMRLIDDYVSFDLPEIDKANATCDNITWDVKVYDKEYNGTDISSDVNLSVEGNKIKGKFPFGYSYITYTAVCGKKSATCKAKLYLLQSAVPCK